MYINIWNSIVVFVIDSIWVFLGGGVNTSSGWLSYWLTSAMARCGNRLRGRGSSCTSLVTIAYLCDRLSWSWISLCWGLSIWHCYRRFCGTHCCSCGCLRGWRSGSCWLALCCSSCCWSRCLVWYTFSMSLLKLKIILVFLIFF